MHFFLIHIHLSFLNRKVQALVRAFRHNSKTSTKILQHLHKLCPKRLITSTNSSDPFRPIDIKDLALYSHTK